MRRGGQVVHAEHPLVGVLSATVPAGELAQLAGDPDVSRLSTDAVVYASGGAAYDLTDGEVLRKTLGLRKNGGVADGGSSWTGDGVGVAVVDSGIWTSPDISKERVAHFHDFTHGGAAVPDFDDYGHGTHVAGLIGGSGKSSKDLFEGPASDARLIGLKVLDANGEGHTSHVIAAIGFAIENRAALGIDIINLSLGHPIFEPAASDPLVQAVEAAVAAGIVVVASAGNHGQSATGEVGYAGITSPGNAPSAITVGSVDTQNTEMRADDTVAPYSSRGPTWYDAYAKPDLVAPGHRLVASAAQLSTLYDRQLGLRVKISKRGAALDKGKSKRGRRGGKSGRKLPKYLRLTGTSMSAGVTSGVVALMLEASRAAQLAPNAVKAILQFTAIPLDGADTLSQGAGGLNALGAVRLASAIDASIPEGAWWLRSTMAPVDMIAGAPVSWAERIIWGGTVYTNEPAWGLGVVWDNRIIWGDDLDESVVWSNRIIWGTLASSPLQVTHVLID